ncbi:MAG: restriction endonuclease, SacI family [bacterium]
MNDTEIRQWLNAEWAVALDDGDSSPDPDIDALVNSDVVSIRYALVTQLLGKIADSSRNLLALQLAAGKDGAWDARSFSTNIVVPWVIENHQVLGTSMEPYASKPLRRERLGQKMPNVRAKEEWQELVALFVRLENSPSRELHHTFRRVLRSLVRRLNAQQFRYPIPQRISMAQLEEILDCFLSIRSGGLRLLVIAVALFTILGKSFSLFSRIRSQGVNEADAASGMPGDIMCYDDNDTLQLVVEVKDQNLTLTHIEASTLKAKTSGEKLANLLFAAPGIHQRDAKDIAGIRQREWASGLNIYIITLHHLSQFVFALLDECWKVEFLKEVAYELDRRGDAQARRGWYDILQNMT